MAMWNETKQDVFSSNTYALYLRGVQFEYWPGNKPSWLKISVFLQKSRWLTEQYFKTGHDNSHILSFSSSINNPTIVSYIVWATESNEK